MFLWMRKIILTLFGKVEAQQQDIPKIEKPVDLNDVFTTHNIKERTLSAQRAYIQQKAIPVIPKFNNILASSTGQDAAVQSIAMDSTTKAAFQMQQGVSENLFSWYVTQGFIGYQACAVIAQQWLVVKACSMRGKDAVRNGFDISINDGEDVGADVLSAIIKFDKKFKLKKNLVEAHTFNNIFGIRHILFKVDSSDPLYYEKPFNPDGIAPGSYKGMSQIDPYWITPLFDQGAVDDPSNIGFYEPTYWQVSGKKIHKSHFVILRGEDVADILKPSYIYGGIPLTQRIWERVYAAERTANEAPQLAMTKRLNVRKMNLAKAVANQKEFENTLAQQASYRDNFGILIAGQDEDVQQLETSLADLDATIMTQYQIVAAIAKVPSTKLLGTSPKGFNATGEHEIKTYHEELENVQSDEFTPIVEMHHICLMKSIIEPKFNVTFDSEIVWNAVDVPSDKEEAETNKMKADIDQIYLGTGAIDSYDIRNRIIKDKASGYNGLEIVERPEYEEEDEILEPIETKFQDKSDSSGFFGFEEKTGTDSTAKDFIKKDMGRWYVYSEKGEKLAGPYQKEKEAKQRLREIEYFKQKE